MRGTGAPGNLTVGFALGRRKDWLLFIKNPWPGGEAAFAQMLNISFCFPDTKLNFTTDFFFFFFASAQSHKYCMFLEWKLFHQAKISLDTVIL